MLTLLVCLVFSFLYLLFYSTPGGAIVEMQVSCEKKKKKTSFMRNHFARLFFFSLLIHFSFFQTLTKQGDEMTRIIWDVIRDKVRRSGQAGARQGGRQSV
jgi:hypothetical protein